MESLDPEVRRVSAVKESVRMALEIIWQSLDETYPDCRKLIRTELHKAFHEICTKPDYRHSQEDK